MKTYPLQLMSVPIVTASRFLNPAMRAPVEAPVNLPNQAVHMIAMANPHILPVLRRRRLVERPEIVKYYDDDQRLMVLDMIDIKERLTIGKKTIVTISSNFSVSAMANPPSLGMTSPIKNPPKMA